MSIDSTPIPSSASIDGKLTPENASGPEQVISSKPDTSSITPEAQALLSFAEKGKTLDEPEVGLQQIADVQEDAPELSGETVTEKTDKQQLSPEHKTKLLGEAMSEFRGVLDGFTQLRSADTTFAEGVGRAVNRIANLANSGEYRRDVLARPIDQLATQFGSDMRNKVRQIGQQAEQMGINRSQIENQMDGLLKQITATEDPVKKAQLIQESALLFQNTTLPLEQARQEKRGQRRGLQQQTEQNASLAKRKSGEASQYTRLDDLSAPVVYERHSRGLVRLLTEGNQSVSAIEDVVIGNNRRHQERFMHAMRRLNGPNDPADEIQAPA